jgi:hypothetical protein
MSTEKEHIDQLREAIERMYGGSAQLTQSLPVRETFEGKPVWEGVVHVFDLTGRPRLAPMPGPRRSRGARSDGSLPCCISRQSIAVRVAIIAEHRTERQ